MMFYTTAAGCVLLNSAELSYTPYTLVCWGHFVGVPLQGP